MDLNVGDKVRYTDPRTSGHFEGTIVALLTAAEASGREDAGDHITQAVLMPKSPDLRNYIGRLGDKFPGGLVLGKAHWDSRLTIL